MLYEALAASGLFFWIAILVAFLFVSWPLGYDNSAGGVIAAAVVIIAFVLLTDVVYRVGVWTLVFLLPVYFLTGVGWALYKWRGYVLQKKADARAEFMSRLREEDFPTWLAANPGRRPTATANKERITGWIALWPWSMSWLVLRFPCRFAAWLYERISTVFERWSAKLWAE